PEWRGNLFVSALAGKALIRLVLKDGRVASEERLLTELNARVRGVTPGPDGALYVLTDGNAGKILRLVPPGSWTGTARRAPGTANPGRSHRRPSTACLPRSIPTAIAQRSPTSGCGYV